MCPRDDVPGGQGPGGEGGEEALDLRDHAGFRRWRLIGPDGGWRLGIGAVFELGGGDGADGQRGHDQHDMTGDRAVEADLGFML
jgi:hypothetical protein